MTDSLLHWDAVVRRADVHKMPLSTHIAPSHRRMPHLAWNDSMALLMDRLFGLGKRKYFARYTLRQQKTCIKVRGFSAGSYTGLSLLHILKDIRCLRTNSVFGAISCPPRLLSVQSGKRHKVHLIHYVPDKLCSWDLRRDLLDSLGCRYTVVKGDSHVYGGRMSTTMHIGFGPRHASHCPSHDVA